jgi:hypothetical protein
VNYGGMDWAWTISVKVKYDLGVAVLLTQLTSARPSELRLCSHFGLRYLYTGTAALSIVQITFKACIGDVGSSASLWTET